MENILGQLMFLVFMAWFLTIAATAKNIDQAIFHFGLLALVLSLLLFMT